ncbi:hypothetical protein EYF80_036918 [Liparis tanakae]|uniref:Uncharacterized protein n=1 Tax=Liparis tanakae TaxID=230148 RepID=A0A4Z2GI84_9TELE|nr:hypothetical protein EYF80_036918 [Liparis tanakae]
MVPFAGESAMEEAVTSTAPHRPLAAQGAGSSHGVSALTSAERHPFPESKRMKKFKGAIWKHPPGDDSTWSLARGPDSGRAEKKQLPTDSCLHQTGTAEENPCQRGGAIERFSRRGPVFQRTRSLHPIGSTRTPEAPAVASSSCH